MSIPLKIADRGRLLPALLAEHIWTRTQNLAHSYKGIEQCRVTVDGPGQHALRDRVRVRIYLSVPGSEIAVTHQGGEDLAIAIRSAFDAADRRLQDYVRLSRQSLKSSKSRSKRYS